MSICYTRSYHLNPQFPSLKYSFYGGCILKKPKISPPNHTQTPNDLFDQWLPHLNESELKVILVIIRKTFGWHKQRDRISLSQMEALTGHCKKHICKAIASLQEKGFIIKEIEGILGKEEVFFSLNVSEESEIKEISTGGLKPPLPVALSHPQKKLTKETKTKTNKKESDQAVNSPDLSSSLSSASQEEEEEKSPERVALEKHCKKERTISRILREYPDPGRILKAIEYTERQSPDNFMAYLQRALENCWELPSKEEESLEKDLRAAIAKHKIKGVRFYKKHAMLPNHTKIFYTDSREEVKRLVRKCIAEID